MGVVDHPDGLVFFVGGTLPGDSGHFEIISQEKRYGFARLVELVTPSPHRIHPRCIHHGFAADQCQGCPWMMIDYSAQLKYKENFVRHFLNRSHLFETTTEIRPIIAAPEPFRYRNRAQFKTDGEILGFVSGETKKIVNISSCEVLTEKNAQTLAALRSQLPNPAWKPGVGFDWNFIDIDEDMDINALQLNRRRTFRQGNDSQNAVMKQWLADQLKILGDHDTALELFCGSGNFTEILAQQGFKNIHAYEVSQDAIEQLRLKSLAGVSAHTADLFKASSVPRIKKWCPEPSLLLLDPPRTGCKILNAFTQAFPSLKTMIYISCDMSTFTFDAHRIQKQGWVLKSIQPIDLFPQTPHVEVMAVFAKD